MFKAEVPSEDSVRLPVGVNQVKFDVEGRWPTGDVFTFARGFMSVLEDQTRSLRG